MTAAEDAGRPFAGRIRLDRRWIQLVLGVVWILDAGLQFQPSMFGGAFVSMVIAPNAVGQPALVGASITHMAGFLGRDVPLWNTLFGLAQLAIGVGILFRRSLRVALAASIAWAFGVWWFGEGFGGIFTGHANALTGAPGAVILYAVVAVLIWPETSRRRDARESARRVGAVTGEASSVAAAGPLGAAAGLWIWSAVWFFLAILQLLPQNRQPGWLSSTLTGAASGQPGWYAHFLDALGRSFAGSGTAAAAMMAAAFVVVAVGPLVSRRSDLFIAAGMAIGVVLWCTGQGLGSILTGMGTDPNSGPIFLLFGAAILPAVLDPPGAPVLAIRAFERHRSWTAAGAVALVVVPFVVSIVPQTAVSSNPRPQPSAAGSIGRSATLSTAGSTGSQVSGPGIMAGMVMAGKPMNMAAMAGLGVTTPNWRYTGPPLSPRERSLLTSVGAATDLGHKMQTPNCTAAPTAAQVLGAVQYVQATSAAVAKYKSLSAAVAAGYRPISSPSYPVVHYVDFKYLNTKDILDPATVDSLVYAFTPYGPVLVAAMYLLPSHAAGPMPYGCLVQWHAHTNLCFSSTTHRISGFTPCGPGEYRLGTRTPYMTHVWQVPVSGGPLAIDPSDLQVVEAAIMAQQQGLAPSTSPVPAA